ncbi:ribosome small subunit-dependent GTPase A [Mycoplasmopsis columbinasalis]|uniref:Small ribosomal subunit biogenesis GTPase RsgA n=1 Tax=Mycoplasmopsis columbinasalis TaxID=114880 RepID=A0A449BA53_9BACT|nr:ribosome small subunit-dependent GTPase A [Mycoplasmopsis columbinasalis]VEU77986.1 GTPase YjeQ/EngC [Mycoplasmopsis columbinasalis]
MQGRIYLSIGGKYQIKDTDGNIHLLPAAGVFRHNNITPLVGDYVEFNNGFVNQILERRNSFVRPKVANIDHIIVVMSAVLPNFSTFLVDKYLALIEGNGVEPIIFVTKTDLGHCQESIWYQQLGYQVYEINYQTSEWLETTRQIFDHKTCSLMGQSGVGKTTFINKLLNLNLETQTIAKNAQRGKHTTRTVQIYDVFAGYLIDTPGFSSLDIQLTKAELARSFKLFKELGAFCKFKTCLHENEPTNFCNIKLNVGTKIPQFRYDNYLKLLKEAK